MQTQPQEPPQSAFAGPISYVVGRDDEGRWLAVEAHGLGGGIFATQDAAVRYASFEAGCPRSAVALASEPMVLRL